MIASYTTPLTEAERATINAAAEIMLAHTAPNASWSLHGNHWNEDAKIDGFSYFTAARTQHTFCRGQTVADKFEWALDQERSEHIDPEAARLRKVAELKAKLAELGETA